MLNNVSEHSLTNLNKFPHRHSAVFWPAVRFSPSDLFNLVGRETKVFERLSASSSTRVTTEVRHIRSNGNDDRLKTTNCVVSRDWFAGDWVEKIKSDFSFN